MKTGSVAPLLFLRTGFIVSQVGFIKPIFAKACGTFIKLNTFSIGNVNVSLPSGIKKNFNKTFFGFIGRNAGSMRYKQYLGKASISKYHQQRIIVRSCAKNPVDHPNGGRTRGKKTIKSP